MVYLEDGEESLQTTTFAFLFLNRIIGSTDSEPRKGSTLHFASGLNSEYHPIFSISQAFPNDPEKEFRAKPDHDSESIATTGVVAASQRPGHASSTTNDVFSNQCQTAQCDALHAVVKMVTASPRSGQ